MISSGKLRHRIRIEANTPVLDTSGDAIQNPDDGSVITEWQMLGEAWAAVEPLSTREFIQSQAHQSKVDTRIILRKQAFTVTAGQRVVHGSNVYNVHGVLWDKDSGLEYMTLPCSTGVNPNGA